MEKKIRKIFGKSRDGKDDNVILLRQESEVEAVKKTETPRQSRRLVDDLSFFDPILENVEFIEESPNNSECLSLQNELNGLMGKFHDRSRRLKAAIEKQNQLVRVLAESREQVRKLEERLADNLHKTESLETDFTRQFRLLEEESHRNKAKAESLTAELNEVRDKLEKRVRSFNELKKTFEELKSNSAEERQRLVEEQQRSLAASKADVKQLVSELNSQRTNFDKFHQQISAKYHEMHKRHKSLQRTLEQKCRRLEEIEAYRQSEKQEFHKVVRSLKEQLVQSRQLTEQNASAYDNEKGRTVRLESDLKASMVVSRRYETRIKTLQEELSEYQRQREKYEAANREVVAKEKELAVFTKQFEALREKTYHLQIEKSRLEADIKRADESRQNDSHELARKKQLIEELKTSLSEKQSLVSSMQKSIDALERDLAEKKRSETERKRELKSERMKNDETAIRLEKVRRDHHSLQQTLHKKEETVLQLQDICRENQSRLSSLNERYDDLEEALHSAREELSGYQFRATADKQRISVLESELDQVTASWRKSQRQLKHRKNEIKRLRDQAISVDEGKSLAKNEELQKRADMLLGRERQLDNYSKNLDQEKNKLRKLAVTLAREIEGSQQLNPLKNYLDITEREISNLEIRLIRLPASAPERSTLELEFEKLIQQRDFLRQLSETTASEVQKNVRRLMKFAHSDELVPIPPVPPGKSVN